MVGKWIKWVMLWVAVTALIGLWTLWRWQTSAPDIELQDILIHFLLIPLGIVLAWWLVLWLLKRWKTKRQAAAAASPASASGQATHVDEAHGQGEQALRQAHVLVVEAAVHTRAGADTATTWSGLNDGSIRPELDRALVDLDGLPVFSARVPDLGADLMAAQEAEAVRLSVRRAVALSQMPGEQLHAALEAVLDAVAQSSGSAAIDSAVAPGASAGAFDLQAKAYLSGLGAAAHGSAHAAPAKIWWQYRVLMPANWSAQEQAALVAACHQRSADLIERAQALGWPHPVWHAEPPESPEAWWAELDADMVRAQREGLACVWTILAVDSALDESTIEHWQTIGELFTAHHQTGRVPGEAAAGLLLISPAMRQQLEHLGSVAWPQPLIRMSRPAIGQRDKSADASGRVSGQTLTQLMQGVLSVLAGFPPAIKVVTDADHRGSRTSEVFDALQAVAPGSDPMASVLRMGEALGDVGMARSLLATALGCVAVRQAKGPQEEQGPVLAAHVQSPRDRVVVALSAVPGMV